LKGPPCEKNFERVNSRTGIGFFDPSFAAKRDATHIASLITQNFYVQENLISQAFPASREIDSKKIG